jgi:hypothetical protein
MPRTATANLPGALGGNAEYWNKSMTPAALLGLSRGGNASTGAGPVAGASLPGSSHMSGDKAAVPWSPDSPEFWLVVIAGTTLLGISGLSLKLRAGPARAAASLGKT